MLRQTSDLMLTWAWLSSRVLASRKGPNGPQGLRLVHQKSESPHLRQPIIKDFFIGKFNYEVFDFPEMESEEARVDLQLMSDSVEKFMTEEVDSRKIDADAKIPDQTLDVLKQMGLFGQQIPTEYGGLGLDAVRFARLAEQTGLDGAISTTLAAHQTLGLKGILLAGTEEQKRKYLPRLASGEDVAAFCLTEPGSGSDAQSIQSFATLSEDGSHFLLNGNKTWVTNGGTARVMTVFAKTEAIGPDGNKQARVTAFIVERDFGGVSCGQPQDKLGLRGANSCTVSFENTPVPVENVLGEIGQGFKLAMAILGSSRCSMGAAALGAMKLLLKDTMQYALTREQFGRPIAQFPVIKEKLGRIASDIYAIESMTYLTADFIDRYGDSAMTLESAAVKIFSSDALWRAADQCLQIYGGIGFTKSYQQERFLRDARAGLLFGSSNEVLRLLVAASGLKFAGLQQPRDLQRLHKPKENFMFSMKRASDMKGCRERPVDPRLSQFVNPLLRGPVEELSKRVNHFRYVVPEILVLHGRDTIEQQMILQRVADNAVDIYAACAVASRGSKALSLAAGNSEVEFNLATAAMQSALLRIHCNNMRLGLSQDTTSDEEDVRIADKILKERRYCAAHPLTRNW